MSIAWVRKYYGVPARRGGRVEYTGGKAPEMATIVSANGGRLRIRFDGSDYTHPFPFHPTWEIRYLDDRCPRCSSANIKPDHPMLTCFECHYVGPINNPNQNGEYRSGEAGAAPALTGKDGTNG